MILHRVDGRVVRLTVAESKLLTSISSATNTCSVASLIASSAIKTEAFFSLTSASSSGSKTRVMLVLLKSSKSRWYHSYIIMHAVFFYLQRVEIEDHFEGYLEEGEEMWL